MEINVFISETNLHVPQKASPTPWWDNKLYLCICCIVATIVITTKI